MIVIVANYLPDAVRGKIKLWFEEPRPNVFVSGIKDSLAIGVVELLMSHCPERSGLIIFVETSVPPFFRIYSKGTPAKSITSISGLQLIVEKSNFS